MLDQRRSKSRIQIFSAIVILVIVCVWGGVEFASHTPDSSLAPLRSQLTPEQQGEAAADAAAAEAASMVADAKAKEPKITERHEWFAADVNFTSCHKSHSPAERIQEIRAMGREPRVDDKTDGDNGSVEIGYSINGGLEETYATFYRSGDECEAALASRNAIPDKYR
jgi:hypothetical protein